ncbi:Ferritin/ribonucleotide reductase [Pestalotiopsis sp. NC0098]|nr:Ferritin/ribonucleotide reductase [Pestalotiopsis sp. NC0098]
MYYSKVALAIGSASLVAAAPVVEKRAAITDADILNYALTLEHLEDTFYREGLAKYTEQDFVDAGYDATFYANLKEVSSDEASHVKFLTGGLTAAGATPVAECTYDFGYTDVKSFLATASILEGVGVSAYLGAAADIMSKTYLTAAGSILTVEARHSAYLRSKLDKSPFPQAFDAPLTLDEVYTLAAPFITSCPADNPTLPVKAFPSLSLDPSTTTPIKAGDKVTLLTPGYSVEGGPVYAAFIAVTGPTFVEATAVDGGFSVEIPEGFAGQTYAVLTGCNETVSDDTVVAGPALIEI